MTEVNSRRIGDCDRRRVDASFNLHQLTYKLILYKVIERHIFICKVNKHTIFTNTSQELKSSDMIMSALE